MRLEPELWDALAEICTRERQNLPSLMRQIEAVSYIGSRTSAVRVFVVHYFRNAASEVEHGVSPHVALCQVTPQTA
jgi:predicted DNA-binding ribbon-helix-helix protein